MKLSIEDVRHVANLARLRLSPEEEARYQHQLSAILEAMAELRSLDTAEVEPTSHASFGDSLLREDVPLRTLEVEKALKNAPEKVGTSFAVPKIIE